MMENGRVDGHRQSRPMGSCHLTILNSVYTSKMYRAILDEVDTEDGTDKLNIYRINLIQREFVLNKTE